LKRSGSTTSTRFNYFSQESLRAKEPPLKLAETRLEFRTHRKLEKP